MTETNFKMVEETGQSKSVYTITGAKGTGKTTLAFRFNGPKYCISFDNKSLRIKQNLYQDNQSIHIYNGLGHYIRTKEKMTETAKTTHGYLTWLMGQIKAIGDCDWIIFDNLERLHEICEMCMRHDYGLDPFQGFGNQSYWKLRRVYLTRLHHLAVDTAKKGVIYTVFSRVDDITIQEGQIIERKEVPKYVDVVEEDTDTLFQTKISNSKDGTKFLAFVVTSKIPKFKTGSILNVTVENLKEA